MVRKFYHEFPEEDEVILRIMEDAVVEKDLHVAEDLFPIVDTAIEVVDGKPKAIAYFEGEKRGTSPDSGTKGKGNKRKRK